MSNNRSEELQILEQVDYLAEEVKALALNLAIYLAKKKKSFEEINRLEPEFMRLVNGTIKVIRDITAVLNAANDAEKMTYDVPSGDIKKDHIEIKLESILDQCFQIRSQLSGKKRRSQISESNSQEDPQ